jgi:hypothetical protein
MNTLLSPLPFARPSTIVGLVLTGALTSTSIADLYVVDPVDGDDVAGSGDVSEPWKTVAHALDQLAPGDTLDLRSGGYDPAGQGGHAAMVGWSPPADAVIRAFPGEAPIIEYGALTLSSSDRGIVFGPDGSGCTVENLTFRGWSQDSTAVGEHLSIIGASSLTLRGCRWIGCGGDFYTVRVRSTGDGSRDLLIEECTFEDNQGWWRPAILLAGDGDDDRMVIRDCVFNKVDALALPSGGRPAIAVTDADSVLIEGCFGYNSGYVAPGSANGSDFIVLQRTTRARIRGCEMKRYIGDWTHGGLDHPLHNSDGVVIAQECESVWVEDCAFWGAGHGVQVVMDSRNVHVSGVYTDSTYDDGIYFDATVEASSATGNVIHHAWDNGIDVKGDDILIQHNTVVRTHSNPIAIWGSCEDVTVLDNLVVDLLVPRSDRGLALEGNHGASATDIVWDHDLYWSPDVVERRFRVCHDAGCESVSFEAWQDVHEHDRNGLLADPLFANPDGRAWPHGSVDFALLPDSPARQAASDGTDIGAIQSHVVGVTTAPPRPGGWVVTATSPFRTQTTLSWSVPDPGATSPHAVRIYDVSGRCLRTLSTQAPALAEERHGGGRPGQVAWDGRDERGRRAPPGVYLVEVVSGTRRATGRVVRVR